MSGSVCWGVKNWPLMVVIGIPTKSASPFPNNSHAARFTTRTKPWHSSTSSASAIIGRIIVFIFAEDRVKSKFLYTGQEIDTETKLHYYNARYYDSHIRRFTQPVGGKKGAAAPQKLGSPF